LKGDGAWVRAASGDERPSQHGSSVVQLVFSGRQQGVVCGLIQDIVLNFVLGDLSY